MSDQNEHTPHQPDSHQKQNKPANKRPLHKLIGHHAKKAGSKFTKYLTERDTIFATLWVFIFIVLLGSIPLNLGVLNPLKLGLKDFDFNDVYYSHVGNEQRNDIDQNITVVNIGAADRAGIAMLVEKVASYKPKVMGLDVLLDGERDPVQDSLMRDVVQKNKNLVLAVKYQEDSSGKLIGGHNFFKTDSSLFGYVNFPYNSETETIRYYYPFKKDAHNQHNVLPSFTSAILKLYDSNAYKRVEKMVDKKVTIVYSRRVTEKKKQYLVVEPETLMTDGVDTSALQGKIVLLAYATPFNPLDIEDKKFTPMNEKYAGKSIPDMNGIIVHANIISMVMEDNFIKKVPFWGNLLLAILVCWLHMSFFIHYYLESHIWFHLAAKIAQVLSAIFFIWLGIEIYTRYHVKVDMKLSLVTIALAVDVIYFYEAWAVWFHRKSGYKTVFKPHHH
ncbi:MAG TPA: CHASE2 domain-containing protein [Chitinophagaceae bacterium]|nr:CHASE2 domain-containing protein [Chitinophagaceae bacterium]HNO01047.1 CHASE2 domain-containing protein [Chitinophagaceae bacterium]